MHLKNNFFNEILKVFIKKQYFQYNFLFSSFQNENYIEIFDHFFEQINKEQNIQIEKYEFFGENMSIDEIREINTLIQNANLHQYYKFIIIHNIEKILQNSTNTLLKTIEEPNSPTIFFFTTQNIYNILPTIKSRCFWINIDYLEKIYNDIFNLQNKENQIKLIKINQCTEININTLIKKDKYTKDEEKIIENYIENNFIKFLKNKKPIHKIIRVYEEEIKQIRDFYCNKKYLFNKTLMKLKATSIIR
jgi:DNA polymerase III delta prime subunit